MQFLTPRNFSFFIMLFAVLLSIFLRPEAAEQEINIKALQDKQLKLIMQSVIMEATLQESIPEERQRAQSKAYDDLFGMLEQQGLFRSEEGRIQRSILLNYIASLAVEKNEGETLPPPRKGASVISEHFYQLYALERAVASDSPLFSLAVGELALLKQYRISGLEGRERDLLEKLKADAFKLQLLSGGLLFGFLAMLGSGVLTFILLIRTRPTVFYRSALELLPEEHLRLLFETPILYLFLTFPVNAFLVGFVPDPQHLLFQFFYLLVCFGASLYYFLSSFERVGPALALFWNGEGLWREVFWGGVGFVCIFPFALIGLVFTILLAGPDALDVRFAHPIVFEVEHSPVLVFLLAVVLAPLLEETIFRVFTYGFFRRFLRIRQAGLITGLFFALLHPQGWVALPYLTLLGAGLCVLREYRPGVLAPMVTHAMVNGLTFVLLVFTR